MSSTEKKAGEGLNSVKFSSAFKATNFELFTKPSKLIMALGVTCFGLSLLYIANMTREPDFTDLELYEDTHGNEQMIDKLLKQRKPKE